MRVNPLVDLKDKIVLITGAAGAIGAAVASAVKCSGAGSKTVKLKPSAATRRALGKAKGAVKVKLGVSLAGKSASRTVTLTRG